MKKTTISVVAAALTVSAATALAQTGAPASGIFGRDDQVFVSVNFGGQTQPHTLEATATTAVYGQTATARTTTGIDGGPIFDLSGEYRFMKYAGIGIGVGAGFSTFGKTGDLSGVASVPHPVFFNQHAEVAIPARDAKRNERSVYLTVVGSYRVTEEIEVAAFIGPSFLHADQELVTGIAVPPGTQDITTIVEKQSANGAGVIAGLDVSYFVTDRIGAGGFMRYNGGSVDLPAAENVKVGGFQLGVGVRIRY
jgi:hypothetical protein